MKKRRINLPRNTWLNSDEGKISLNKMCQIVRKNIQIILKGDLITMKNKYFNGGFINAYIENSSEDIYIFKKSDEFINNDNFNFVELTTQDNKKYIVFIKKNCIIYEKSYTETIYFHLTVVFNKHIILLLFNNEKKEIEYFDPSGKKQKTLHVPFIIYNILPQSFKHYTFFLLNQMNLQQSFKSNEYDMIIYDNFCQTWIYWYLYHRIKLNLRKSQIFFHLQNLTCLEKHLMIESFWFFVSRYPHFSFDYHFYNKVYSDKKNFNIKLTFDIFVNK